jgi:endoglucanase
MIGFHICKKGECMVKKLGFIYQKVNLEIFAIILLMATITTSVAAGNAIDSSNAKNPPINKADWDIKKQNSLFGKGINLGNVLDAPKEGEWGPVLQEKYFAHVKQLGFQSVRIPVRWSTHVSKVAPYTIDSVFLKRVEWAVDQALKNKLRAVINVHHYEDLMKNPQQEKPVFLAMWRQIADHFSTIGPELYFEICNEPRDELKPALWNEFAKEALDTIRKTNPYRSVIIGPGSWNSIGGLPGLQLPPDNHLILTVHYYKPEPFTHQAASWVSGSDSWKGTKWYGADADTMILVSHFNKVDKWAKEKKIPVYLGEFGAYDSAGIIGRVLYTSCIAKQAMARGWSFAYWKYNFDFGIYDDSTNVTRLDLVSALFKPSETFKAFVKKIPLDTMKFDTVNTPSVLIDDFEDTLNMQNSLALLYSKQKNIPACSSHCFWSAWYNDSSKVTDFQGTIFQSIDKADISSKKISLKLSGPWGKNGKCLHVKGVLKGNAYPQIMLSTGFTGKYNKDWFDLSKLTAISFWAKGTGAMRVNFITERILNGYPSDANWGHMGSDFGLTSKWKQYVIPVKDLKPKAWSAAQNDKITWQDVMTKVCSIEISTNQSYDLVANDPVDIYIDDIKLYGVGYDVFGLTAPK